MPTDNFSNIGLLSNALGAYLQEVEMYKSICTKHADTTALHTRSKELEVYRMFDRREESATALHRSSQQLPSWEQSLYWKSESVGLQKLEREVDERVRRHKKLHPIVTRGISWNNRPIVIHAYKFEPDPYMKLELIVPKVKYAHPELPILPLVDAIQCLEYLIPSHVAKPLSPYSGHEARFQTIDEYTSQLHLKELYALQGFPSPNASQT